MNDRPPHAELFPPADWSNTAHGLADQGRRAALRDVGWLANGDMTPAEFDEIVDACRDRLTVPGGSPYSEAYLRTVHACLGLLASA